MTLSLFRAKALARSAFLLVSLVSTAAFAAAPAAVSKEELARYADELFTRTYPAGEPGAAVLVLQGGRPVLRKGYGMANLELGVPIRPEMVFELGSITKQFTAAAVMLIVGLLSGFFVVPLNALLPGDVGRLVAETWAVLPERTPRTSNMSMPFK